MKKIEEEKLIEILKNSKNALLIEPEYRRKYLPLGLAKIANFIKKNGGKVTFSRKCIIGNFDSVFITSLFTYDSQPVIKAINEIKFIYKEIPIILGGVYASLMPDHAFRFSGATIFSGYSKTLDQTPPDYNIDWDIDDPWNKFSFVFTSRGCPNKCAYCAVWRIESNQWINPTWRKHIDSEKPYVMISDNNLSALNESHINDVIEYLSNNKKSVVFDNGFDCKHITNEMANSLAKLKYTRHGMRLAFDRIEEDGIFQIAVEKLIGAGIPKSQIMAYVLFNFKDTPQEADYRMRECVKLGIRPYPQQYTPLNKTNRNNIYIGKHWSKNLLRTFRYFWLMAGCYTKNTFDEYLKTNNKAKLTELDLGLWKQPQSIREIESF